MYFKDHLETGRTFIWDDIAKSEVNRLKQTDYLK